MASYIGRRKFLAALGGAAAAWPLVARAQQAERVRRIGVLMNLAADDAEGQLRIAAFLQALQQLGWSDGRNVRIDYRWAAGDAGRFHKYAEELLALVPDVIFAASTPSVQALQQATRRVPIVFAIVADPVGAGFVDSLARPGGNVTGFTPGEYGMSGKWLELIKELVPRVTRVAVLRDLTIGLGQLGAIQSVAPSLGIELRPVNVRDSDEIERSIAAFAQGSNGALIVTASTPAIIHRELITTLAARNKLPAVYYTRYWVEGGGLMSYGPDFRDQFRRAADYVDRVLKGEKPADLPVQAPTKYELVINLKTAKALGLTVPDSLLARADEVIE
jgi:putative tryptophan/tyrosine transport system substrate-binding protein